jgi:hypothetical protein
MPFPETATTAGVLGRLPAALRMSAIALEPSRMGRIITTSKKKGREL